MTLIQLIINIINLFNLWHGITFIDIIYRFKLFFHDHGQILYNLFILLQRYIQIKLNLLNNIKKYFISMLLTSILIREIILISMSYFKHPTEMKIDINYNHVDINFPLFSIQLHEIDLAWFGPTYHLYKPKLDCINKYTSRNDQSTIMNLLIILECIGNHFRDFMAERDFRDVKSRFKIWGKQEINETLLNFMSYLINYDITTNRLHVIQILTIDLKRGLINDKIYEEFLKFT